MNADGIHQRFRPRGRRRVLWGLVAGRSQGRVLTRQRTRRRQRQWSGRGLVSRGRRQHEPVLVPNGRWIVFDWDRDEDWDIFVVSAWRTAHPVDEVQRRRQWPDWSPMDASSPTRRVTSTSSKAPSSSSSRRRSCAPRTHGISGGQPAGSRSPSGARRAWRNGARRRGAAGRREARTRGASIFVNKDATEDAASRRSSAPPATSEPFRRSLEIVPHREAVDELVQHLRLRGQSTELEPRAFSGVIRHPSRFVDPDA